MRYLPHHPREPRRGVVLLAVLIVVVLLTLAAYQYSELMMAEYKATSSYTRATQARTAAESGINYAAILLSDPNAFANQLNSNPFNNPTMFQAIPVSEGNGPPVYFSVIAPLGPDEQQSNTMSFRYGAVDESGKINVNGLLQADPSGTLAAQILTSLLGDPNVANAIIDWIDPDDTPRQGGAESDTYAGMQPPYYAKNGPLDTLEELLLVQGVTWDLLFGTDLNRNGMYDASEQQLGAQPNQGWSAYLTVYSREQNVDSAGNPRTYVNDSNTQTLYTNLTNLGLTTGMANFIMVYRQYGPMATPAASPSGGSGASGNSGAAPAPTPAKAPASSPSPGGTSGNTGRTPALAAPPAPVNVTADQLTQADLGLSTKSRGRRIASLFELVNASVQIPSPNRQQPARIVASPLKDPSQLATLLPTLLDQLTTTTNSNLPARVNVNTAPQAVLLALPGLAPNDVTTIMSTRPDPNSTTPPDPKFSTVAWLLTDAKLSVSTLQTLDRFITARTQVYRVQVVGHFANGGPASRLEAVIDTNRGRPRIVYWRDLTELGPGFDLTGENAGQ